MISGNPPTVRALLTAPLGALAVAAPRVLFSGSVVRSVITCGLVFLVCYIAELFFVVPVLLLWPQLRRPPIWVAAICGVVVAWCTAILLTLLVMTGVAPGPR